MWLQTVPLLEVKSIRSSAAIYVVEEALPPGTYYLDIYSSSSANKTFSFTTTKEIPAGGCIGYYDASTTDPHFKTFASNHIDVIEGPIYTTANSTDGTNLGVVHYYHFNENNTCFRLAYYGENNWRKSPIRKYLNSDSSTTYGWTPEDKWDTDEFGFEYRHGFLSELPSEMVDAMLSVKIPYYYYDFANATTNTYTSSLFKLDYVYDKVTIPTCNQMYIKPAKPIEKSLDSSHEYWKTLNGTDTTWTNNVEYSSLIAHDLDNVSRRQWLRGIGNSPASTCAISSYGVVSYGSYVYNSCGYSPMVCIGKAE